MDDESVDFYNKVLFIFIIHMSELSLSLSLSTSDCNTDLSFLQQAEQTPSTRLWERSPEGNQF